MTTLHSLCPIDFTKYDEDLTDKREAVMKQTLVPTLSLIPSPFTVVADKYPIDCIDLHDVCCTIGYMLLNKATELIIYQGTHKIFNATVQKE